jgi:hypothetical protein
MKLESDLRTWQPPTTSKNIAIEDLWHKFCNISMPASLNLTPYTWVKLFNPPTAFSFDEAWLLCQCGENQWIAWVPEYGEITVNTDEFCIPA